MALKRSVPAVSQIWALTVPPLLNDMVLVANSTPIVGPFLRGRSSLMYLVWEHLPAQEEGLADPSVADQNDWDEELTLEQVVVIVIMSHTVHLERNI